MRSIEWLAGLLEGEGYFGIPKSQNKYLNARITLRMTDEDVVKDAAVVLGAPAIRRYNPAPGSTWKPVYQACLTGIRAVERMLAIFPHMGVRRRAKIDEILHVFEHHTAN